MPQNKIYTSDNQSSVFNIKENTNQFFNDLSETNFKNLLKNSAFTQIQSTTKTPLYWNNSAVSGTYDTTNVSGSFAFPAGSNIYQDIKGKLDTNTDYTIVLDCSANISSVMGFGVSASNAGELTNYTNNLSITSSIVSASISAGTPTKHIIHFRTANIINSSYVRFYIINTTGSPTTLSTKNVTVYKGKVEIAGILSELSMMVQGGIDPTKFYTRTKYDDTGIAVSGTDISFLNTSTITGTFNIVTGQVSAAIVPSVQLAGQPTLPVSTVITAANQITTKEYVDAVAVGLSPKRAVTTVITDGTAVGTVSLAGTTHNGYTLVAGDRVLFNNTALNLPSNGIYVIQAGAVASVRAEDYNNAPATGEIKKGDYVLISNGSLSGTGWVMTNNNFVTLGTDNITFTMFSQTNYKGVGNILVNTNTISFDTNTLTLGTLTVTGNNAVSGNENIVGNLSVSGNTNLKLNLTVSGNEVIGGTLTVSGSEDIKGSLTVSGNEIVGGTLTVLGNENVSGSLNVAGNATVSGISVLGMNDRLSSMEATGTGHDGSYSGEDFTYNYLLVSLPYNQMYYDVLTSSTGITLAGSPVPVYDFNTSSVSGNTGSTLTVSAVSGSTTFYKFFLHVDKDVSTNATYQYSTDGVTFTNSCSADVNTVVAGGFTKLYIRVTWNGTGKLYSLGIAFNESSVTTSSNVRLHEVYTSLVASAVSGAIITLPNGSIYTKDGKSLDVFLNRIKLVVGIDYDEYSNTQIQLRLPLLVNDTFEFVEQYGYIDTSVQNQTRITSLENTNITYNSRITTLEVSAVTVKGVGDGQTWQAVTRNSTQVYTNDTGRPIVLNVYSNAQPFSAYIYVGAVQIGMIGNQSANATDKTFTGIIPTGATYHVDGNSYTCVELR